MKSPLHVAVLILIVICAASCPGLAAPGGAAPNAAASAASAQSTAGSPAPAIAPPMQSYRLTSGDTVAVTVWGQSQFSQECQVNAAGTISYPMLGDVPSAGLTCAELEARLTDGLGKYLKRPRVSVRVSAYGTAGASVFVLGEVNKPGVYPVVGAGGLMQAIAAAGGATSQASGEITIVSARTGASRTTGIEQAVAGAGADPLARPEPGDVVYVNRRADANVPQVYTVLGEVPSPGVFDLPANGEARVLGAMQKAGLLDASRPSGADTLGAGTDERLLLADLEHAILTRGDVMVPLDLAALLRGDVSQNLLLQSGDVLTVPRRHVLAVSVLGEVRSPGKRLLGPDATLLDLLAQVGGLTAGANQSGAVLLRQKDGAMARMQVDLGGLLRGSPDPGKDVRLQDGDILVVPSKGDRSQSLWRWLPFVPYLLR